jgi:hypothetical protein
MTDEALTYYARKFFPHLLLHYGRLAVIAVLTAPPLDKAASSS